MPRRSRIVIPGVPHHITQRGNYRQPVFKEPEDFAKYSYWMNRYAAKYELEILAYCLMDNHVHFIVIPCQPNSLALTLNTTHMRYAQHLNKKEKRKDICGRAGFFPAFYKTPICIVL